MKIFISYSRYDRPLAERINTALNAAGFDTFLDTKNLPIGQEFNARIKFSIDTSDLFLFLASQNSVRPGSYALTELSFAESKWRNPSGYVLPILLEDFDFKQLPAYLSPINALKIKGNAEAEVVGWVIERATHGTEGTPGLLTPLDRLKYWARLAQPPLRKGKRVMLWEKFPFVAIGFGLVAVAIWLGFAASEEKGLIGTSLFCGLVGLIVTTYSIRVMVQGGLRGDETPVALVILDRDTGGGGIVIHAQTLDGKRLMLIPRTKSATEAYSGDLGWAYIRGRMLFDFIPAGEQGN